MRDFDLNCDMGEGCKNDHLIMPYITAVNIACGGHAGTVTTMKKTVTLALKHNVKIGAHPSFIDKKNFGRVEIGISPEKVYRLIYQQLEKLKIVCDALGAQLHHVKPHGALYNMAARDKHLAKAIAYAVHDFDLDLVLYGLSGSQLIKEGNLSGLKTASEVFADRTYQDDGSLTPRSRVDALITDQATCLRQVKMMIEEGVVISTSGKKISIKADTVCVHGDGAHAVEFAKAIFDHK